MLISTDEGTLDKKVVYEWTLKYHYAKRKPPISKAFGWVENGELKAVLSIGKPASNQLCIGVCGREYSSYVYELNRICAKDTMIAPLSQFVALCLKQLPNYILVSYADTAMSHVGYIYQATNWIYTGATRARTDIKSEGHSRHYDKQQDYKVGRVARSSKHRYINFTGDKRFKKLVAKSLKYKQEPYPKGDNKKYEINWE